LFGQACRQHHAFLHRDRRVRAKAIRRRRIRVVVVDREHRGAGMLKEPRAAGDASELAEGSADLLVRSDVSKGAYAKRGSVDHLNVHPSPSSIS
jgi:hypothetical protein